jgi:hypothetical protein
MCFSDECYTSANNCSICFTATSGTGSAFSQSKVLNASAQVYEQQKNILLASRQMTVRREGYSFVVYSLGFERGDGSEGAVCPFRVGEC